MSRKAGPSPNGPFPPGGKVRKTLTWWFLPWLLLDTGAQQEVGAGEGNPLPGKEAALAGYGEGWR